jgi:hypothetical protein
MADSGLFAPLSGSGRRPSAAPGADPWRPILPVPDDAPRGPPRHESRGEPSGCWEYRDAAGELLGYVIRVNGRDGTVEFLPATFCRNAVTGTREWRVKSWTPLRPLYRLDSVAKRPGAPVVVCEGEKAADAAAELLPDQVAVTSPNGAKSAGKADWAPLAGRKVTIWPDNDDEGRAYAATVATALRGIAASIAIAAPPACAAEKWDAADALAEGWESARAAALIAAAVPAHVASPTPTESGNGRRRRRSDDLLDFLPEIELWHSPDRDAFATITIGGHVENWPVRSRDFREFLSGRYFAATGTAPGSQATEDALRVVEGAAKHNRPQHAVHLRIGEQDGAVFIDLGDAAWQAVEVTSARWRVIDRAPIKFVRSPAMRALPMPEHGGLIEGQLRELVNVRDDADFALIVGWIIGCLNPRGPYPILVVNGEQGSAKSTLCRLLRSLTDPNAAPIRLTPRNEDDLIVAARHSRVLAFDNMSGVPYWFSDALCSIATGAGVSTREHYSNTNEVVFEGARPCMLNGIPDLGSRADFADRTIHVVLKPIAEADRRSETEYWKDVETRAPLIFGAILDAVAGALRHRDETPPVLTRMADFVAWVSAAEPALGWDRGASINAYLSNRRGAIETAIEGDPIGDAVCQLAGKTDDWTGSPTDLLARLAELVSDTVRKNRTWPASNKLRGR